MVQIKDTEQKLSSAKRTINLKGISVKNLKLIEFETGEDVSKQVIDAVPFEQIDFKISFEIPEELEENDVEAE